MTRAVLDAVRNDLDREMRARRRVGLAEELMEIGRRCAESIDPARRFDDHATLLYDERGLPK